MENWINTPGIVLVALAVGGLIFKSGQWIQRVNSDRKSFQAFMDEVRRDIKEIRDDIKKIFGRFPATSVTGSSPLRLTDIGEAISRKLEAKSWARGTAPELVPALKHKRPCEIQDASYKYVKETFAPDDEQLVELQACADEIGIKLDGVLDVLAVELRDRLLALLQEPDNQPTAEDEPSADFQPS